MPLDALYKVFEENEEEHGKFENVTIEDWITKRANVHALLLMDKLVPGECDAISAVEPDQIWLSVALEDLAKAATED